MKYNVTFVKAYTITVDVTDGMDEKDIEEEAYDQMVNDFVNGDAVEPTWEMSDCQEE